MFTVANVLTVAFNMIAKNGYVKKTVVDGERWVRRYGRNTLVPNYVEQDGNTCRATLNALKAGDVSSDETLAEACISTYYKFVQENRNDFGQKILALLSKQELSDDEVMQVAFVPVFYFKQKKHDEAVRAREEERKSFNDSLAGGFFAEVGEKVNTSVTLIKQGGFDGAYGYTHIYTFLSADKHVLVWFSTKDIDVEIGQIVNIRGTVKGHKEYNGTKQTIITRCKVSE